jgi:hypothetical protein
MPAQGAAAMIVNHRYRFIFLKTKKTAGTSLEIALSRYCDGNDILSRIGRRDEPKRAALGYQGPANYLVPKERYTRRDWFRHYLLRKEICYWNHMPAREIRERVGTAIWDSYFKFCVERNPWDRVVSAYYWENRGRKRLPDFYRFMDELERRGLLSNWTDYAIDDRIVVDRVYLYEDLQAGLADLTGRLGFAEPLELPDAKRGIRPDSRPYQELYSERSRDRVARACAREIAAFGYRF